jgi:hypothetical protein
MNIAKTSGGNVKILNAETGNLKFSIPVKGVMAGNAQIQGTNVIIQLKEGPNTRTKIYDTKTGMLKANIA